MTTLQTGTGEATQIQSATARRLLIERRLRGGDGLAPIPRVARDGPLPLSPGQVRLWFLDALVPGSTEWVVPIVLRREHPFDVPALRRALDALERRHEALRTRYAVAEGEPSQEIIEPAGVPLEVVDEADVAATIQAAQALPFELGSGRLLRAVLARETDGADWLVLTTHHIACDGWSTELLARDLASCYAAELDGAPAPAAPTLQYADFAAWAAAQRPAAEELAYWHDQLRDIQTLELPTDRPRGVVRDASARRQVTELDGPLAALVRETARRFATTPFTILVTAFGLMLARRSGQPDICIGTPVAGRPRTQLHGIVGYFANTLVLRIRCDQAKTAGDLVTAGRERVLAALAHQNVPFEQIVRDVAPERVLSRNAITDVLFVYEQVGAQSSQPGPDDLTEIAVTPPTVKSDLLLGVRDDGSGSIVAGVDYATALFDDETAAAMAADWVRCVAFLCADQPTPLDQLPLVDSAEEAWLAGLDGPPRKVPDRTLQALIREQAQRTPGAVAVEDRSGSLTYAQLVERAAGLASRLTEAGPDAVVGVCLERGVDLLVTLVGVLASGAAYLPLDPDHPPARLAELVAAVDPAHVVTSSELRARLPDDLANCVLVDDPLPTTRRWAAGAPADLAYVLHTSGSTGAPKGVMIPHRGIVNRLQWMQSTYGLRPDDRVLQKTPITFDVSVWELFWPLLVGARVVFAPPGLHLEPARLADFASERQVTHAHFVPSMLDLFLDLTTAFPTSVREIFCSGEALRAGTVRRLAERSICRVHNLYGPTEASVDVTYRPVPPVTATDPVPIGQAVDNTTVHILDRSLRRCPRGVVGEIHLGGVQLARGYLHRPDLTAGRFVPDPFGSGGRLYRTGDRGYVDGDGAVVYVGRADTQIKIRGVRIEPGEVEAALCDHPQVTGACVCVAKDAAGDAVLVGHVTGAGPVDQAELRDLLTERLPAAFVPAYFAQHAAFPMTTSGKTDRGALAAAGVPVGVGGHARRESRSPGPVEHVIVRVFEEVLGRTEVGVEDSFFAIGGDSMRAVRVVGALNDRGLAVAVADLFRAPTAALLARVTGTAADDERSVAAFELVSNADRKRVPGGVTDMFPLSQIQAGMIFEMLGDAAVRPYHNVTSYPVRDQVPFDRAAFERAALRVAERHEVLRTSVDLVSYELPMQLVHSAPVVDVVVENVRAAGAGAEEAVMATARAELARPFVLERSPLWRLRVHVVSDTVWWLTEVECHVVLDGWSHNLMIAELLRTYRAERDGQTLTLPVPQRRFADFVAAEQRVLSAPAARQFWSEQLDGVAANVIPVGCGEPRPIEKVATVERDVSVLAPDIAALAQRVGVPIKTVYLAATAVALETCSSASRPVLGVVSQGRTERAGGDEVFGMFLNTLPFVAPQERTSWSALLTDTFAAETAMLPHRRYPLSAIVRSLPRTERLVEASFNFLDFYTIDDGTVGLGDAVDHSPNEFPLVVTVIPGRLQATVHTERLSIANAVELLNAVEQVLAKMTSAPGDAAALPGAPWWRAADTVVAVASVGEAVDDAVDEPRNETVETAVLTAMSHVLGEVASGELDLDSDFFALGGHSLTAMRLAALLQADGFAVSPHDVVGQRTPRRIAAAAAPDRGGRPSERTVDPVGFTVDAGLLGPRAPTGDPQELVAIPDPVVWLERTGPDRPWVFVHPGGGGVHWYRELARLMPAHVPVAGLQSPAMVDPGFAELSVRDLAQAYVAALDGHALGGEINLLGWCGGTAITWELSRQLLDSGRAVGVFLLDASLDSLAGPDHEPTQLPVLRRCQELLEALDADPSRADTWPEIAMLLRHIVDDERARDSISDNPDVGWLEPVRTWRLLAETRQDYDFPLLDAPVHLLLSGDLVGSDDAMRSGHTLERYLELFAERMATPPSVHHVAGSHYAVLRHPHVTAFAELITQLANMDAIASHRAEADI